MRSPAPLKTLLLAAVAALALAAPPVAAFARSRHPVAEIPPPPPPPPPAGPVGMPDQMIDDAGAYEGLILRVIATSPAFTNGESVDQALKNGAAYEPKAFLRGAIAYGAVAALKSEAFVKALRAAGDSPDNRAAMVRDIETNPVYLYQFPGVREAAGYAKAALGASAVSLDATGRLIYQAAYDVQHQAWSGETIADRPGRLSAVEAESANGIAPAPDETPTIARAATEAQPLSITASPVAPPYAPMINQALQVAAVAALGEATNTSFLNLATLVRDQVSEACLDRAKRDLFQCLAVAKPNYEDIFCMGQHEMIDPSNCLANAVGALLPPEPLLIPPPILVKVERRERTEHHRRHKHRA